MYWHLAERRYVKGIKNISVCKGCKYFLENSSYTYLDKTCNFIEMTRKSRILIEKQNGGVKRDSCVCYEKKQRKNKMENGYIKNGVVLNVQIVDLK